MENVMTAQPQPVNNTPQPEATAETPLSDEKEENRRRHEDCCCYTPDDDVWSLWFLCRCIADCCNACGECTESFIEECAVCCNECCSGYGGDYGDDGDYSGDYGGGGEYDDGGDYGNGDDYGNGGDSGDNTCDYGGCNDD